MVEKTQHGGGQMVSPCVCVCVCVCVWVCVHVCACARVGGGGVDVSKRWEVGLLSSVWPQVRRRWVLWVFRSTVATHKSQAGNYFVMKRQIIFSRNLLMKTLFSTRLWEKKVFVFLPLLDWLCHNKLVDQPTSDPTKTTEVRLCEHGIY